MNNKIKHFFIVWIILSFANLTQAAEDLWQEVHTKARSVNTATPYRNSREFVLDEAQMQQLLGQTALAFKGGSSAPIALPLPNGDTVYVTPIESPVLPPQLAQKYPQIKTYKLIDQNNKVLNGRLDFTPAGFHAMLQTHSGEVVYIDPVQVNANQQAKNRHYYSYQQKDQHASKSHQCKLTNAEKNQSPLMDTDQSYQYRDQSSSKNLHNYRIAIAATGEYTRIQGGTVALGLSAIATTLNRINQIYERDLGVHFTLADNNDAIIFTDAYNDPFSNGKSHLLIIENQKTLDTLIGPTNYDIGHVFGSSGGGLAIINSLCSTHSKAKGASGINNPNSENFYIDFVAHEIAHQFGATHTFNSKSGLCAGSTRTKRTAFEPGSGSTIMAYTGICGSDNLQLEADAMFHIGSIEQINNTISKRCGSHYANSNQPPLVNAGKDYTIPAGTPFTLKGSANDPENDFLSYSWQQVDVGSSSSVNYDTGNNPLFRAHLATTSPIRTFPELKSILTHRQIRGEVLPQTQRSLNFKFTVQDGKKNTSSDQLTLQVKNTGTRFALDLPYSHYTIGEDTKLTWNVAKTDQAPIHCSDIDIYLSTDGGKTFSTKLASNIVNNGSTSVYIPNHIDPSDHGRFKIACSDNIFFALSYYNFELGYDASNHQASPLPEPNLTIGKKSQANNGNNQNLTPTYGNEKMRGGAFSPFYLLLMILVWWQFKKKSLARYQGCQKI
ncbi:MAG: hypothetical protein KAG34_04785 [Cocleimonas sp.]|nr:hypothetical protein [Cocleimonas sp.]